MAAVPPTERLLPHKDAMFVTQIEEPLRLLVVRTTDEVAAKGF